MRIDNLKDYYFELEDPVNQTRLGLKLELSFHDPLTSNQQLRLASKIIAEVDRLIMRGELDETT